jgi:hypothetical protein
MVPVRTVVGKARQSTRGAARRLRRLQLLLLQLVGRALPRSRRDEHARRLVAHVPTFLPEHRAGSEVSMARTLEGFRARGWNVTVLVDAPGTGGELDGMTIVRRPSIARTFRTYRDSQVVLTQLGSRNRAMRWSALTGRPLVLFLRMGGVNETSMLGSPDLLVFNADWLQRASTWTGNSVVQHPPIDPGRYRTTPGSAVTLVNVTPQKGSEMLLELARRCPDLEFIGVRGGWGDQLEASTYPNVEVIDPVDDMREVYRRTAILLMPSTKESFGRVGLEAACSGIPTVATPLPGIREALADAALYADRDDPDAWERHVRSLQDPTTWAVCSRRALERADHWASRDEMGDLVRHVESLVHGGPLPARTTSVRSSNASS